MKSDGSNRRELSRAAIAVVSLACLSFVQPVEAGQIASYPFPGAWTGGAFSDDTGKFSTCLASASYRSDTELYVVVDSEYGWALGFFNGQWKMKAGRQIPLEYRFDGGVWFRAEGTAIDRTGFRLPMPADATLIELFRRGRTLEIAFSEGKYGFNLTSTFKLTAALASCVAKYGADPREPAPKQSASVTASTTPSEDAEPKGPSSGTGIVVSSDIVLTNFHVVEHCSAYWVTQSGDVPRAAQLLRSDKQNDLAILKVGAAYGPEDAAVFRRGSAGQAGETIAVYGYPLAGMLSAAGNIVSGNITALSGLGDDVRFFQISAPVQPGNSGGPLIDSGGLVLGVVNARISDMAVLGATGTVPQNINFAIKGNVATNFLDAHSIPYRTAASEPDLSLVDIAGKARRFGVYVECS